MKTGAIVHQYFKKVFEDGTVLVKVNPIHFTGEEIFIPSGGEPPVIQKNMTFDEEIFDDLSHDGFLESSALEFQLVAKGLA